MSIFELDAKAAIYFDIMEQIDALNAGTEAVKEAVKPAMVEIEQEEITGHGWRATWRNTSTTRSALIAANLRLGMPASTARTA